MPVAGLLASPPSVPLPTSDIPNVVLTGGDGQQWVLTDPIGSQVLLMPGATGLSLPPNTPYLSDTPALPGALRTGYHDDPRAVFLPVYCEGNTRQQHRDNLRALERSIHPSRGVSHLSWAEADGSRRYLDMTYVTGAEGNDAADNAQLQWEIIGLNFVAENPYLYGDLLVPSPWIGAVARPFFPLRPFPITLTPSSVFGGSTVNNVGDMPAWPTWVLHGPATSLTIALGTGESFTLDMSATPLLVGQVITISTDPKLDVYTVVDDTTANRFGLVNPGAEFWPLPIGISAFNITVAGATSATSLQMSYRPQYLRV